MTPNEVNELILARFEAAWAEATPVVYDNEAAQPEPDAAYLKLTIREVGGGQDTLGEAPNRKFRRKGVISAEIRTPTDKGTLEADTLSHNFRTIFEGVTFSQINCFDALKQTFGPNGKWYLVTVDVNFEYDEVK